MMAEEHQEAAQPQGINTPPAPASPCEFTPAGVSDWEEEEWRVRLGESPSPCPTLAEVVGFLKSQTNREAVLSALAEEGVQLGGPLISISDQSQQTESAEAGPVCLFRGTPSSTANTKSTQTEPTFGVVGFPGPGLMQADVGGSHSLLVGFMPTRW